MDFRVVCSAEHGRLCNNVNSELVGGGGGGGGRHIMKTGEECLCCRESASAIPMA